MERVEKYVEVEAPIRMVYNQWTQFEDFPRFMEGVKSVKQTDDTHLHWVAEIAGKEKEWAAEITKQEPDRLIAWRSLAGDPVNGIVTFDKVNDSTTKVTVQMEYDPKGFVETLGDSLGIVSMRIEGDLKRFKKFIEDRGRETGGWRGSVEKAASNA